MTLTLLLMRHAKSAFALEGFSDHERPLSARGRLAVPEVAKKIVALECDPEVIYCSDALRTKETLELLVPSLMISPQIELSRTLYQAAYSDLIHFVEDRHPKVKNLMILNHNPTLEVLVEYLTDEYRNIKPADVVILTHSDTTWDRALNQKGSWEMVTFLSADS